VSAPLPPLYTVSALTLELAHVVAGAFPLVRVEGEVGSIVFHTSGHWYLTLKDGGAVLNAAMFRGANRSVAFRPAVGDNVVATGSLDIYAKLGRYNLVISHLAQAGAGSLQARFEALKARLAAEGLFAEERKRPIPRFPGAVAVITSTDGAALHDFLKVHSERFPSLPVYVAACRVQGEGAAAEVVAAFSRVARHGRVDVVVLARGGGSPEDLWTFNEESVVRAIATCPVPVVSGIGHETDWTLADLVADRRAATPTHAAQSVFPERRALLDETDRLDLALVRAIRRFVRNLRDRFEGLRRRLHDPRRRVAEARIRCDELSDRLVEAFVRCVAERRVRLGQLDRDLGASISRLLERKRHRFEQLSGRLAALSPYATLDRGYVLVRREGRVVARAADLSTGDDVELRFSQGTAGARITGVSSPPDPSSPPPRER
jgi:exodeoxyribonuclease VII large subunit